jgi:hypothetical protein
MASMFTHNAEDVMQKKHIEIAPSTKVGEMLDNYPELEETLIGIAPPFKKLKNPFLRKSVDKVVTLKYIASVGNVPLGELINKLRKAVGQPVTDESYEDENYFLDQPDWFSPDKIVMAFDEAKVEDKTRMTLATMLIESKEVKKGEIIELTTTFLPAPGIDRMKSMGYSVWTRKEDENLIKTYFMKNID